MTNAEIVLSQSGITEGKLFAIYKSKGVRNKPVKDCKVYIGGNNKTNVDLFFIKDNKLSVERQSRDYSFAELDNLLTELSTGKLHLDTKKK